MSVNPPPYSTAPPKYDVESPLLPGEGSSSTRSHGLRDDDEPYKGATVSQSSLAIRMAFVRKVYSILAVQLLGTIIVCAIFMYNASVKDWVQHNLWPLYVSMIGTFVVLFALYFKSRSTPTNFYLLGLFTALESYTVGVVVTFYDQTVVLQALIVTFGIFVGLSLFTLQSKWDFSGMAPFLFAGISLLILFSFVGIIFPFGNEMHLALAIVGVVLFSAFIIFDTYLLFNKLSPEDYIEASISLYLDIINLFLQLLRIFAELQRD